MIDLSIVRQRYLEMTDSQLIHLAEKEGHQLSAEALSVLQDEFSKRNLDEEVFFAIRASIKAKLESELHNIDQNQDNPYSSSLWEFCFSALEDRKTFSQILEGLVSMGLDKEQSLSALNILDEKIKENIKQSEREEAYGGIICVLGIAVTILTFSFSMQTGSFVVAWGAIIFGGIRFFKAVSRLNRFGRIQKILNEETKVEL